MGMMGECPAVEGLSTGHSHGGLREGGVHRKILRFICVMKED
jgi:hypothetical protein